MAIYAPHASNRNYSTMEELPETLKAEIEALDSLDARALKRRYEDIVADMPKCALSSVLRATIAYRLQERHYGQSLSKETTECLDEAADDKRMSRTDARSDRARGSSGSGKANGTRRPSGTTGGTNTTAKYTRPSRPWPRPSPGRTGTAASFSE